ncbi:hypothetical protein DFH09DRAFT_1093421 [Mycena vulgaris]|nr:hypothetical protein DFH09DRAFT_1093421 [Mycena vulgaris]
MTDELWRSLSLSSHAKSLSGYVADLRSSMPAEFFENKEVQSKLEVLEAEIAVLRSVFIGRPLISLPQPPNALHTTHPDPAIQQLAQRAQETLWDELPLRAILDAHKHRMEDLAKADKEGQHSAEIYVAYCKFLQLYPDPKDQEYRQLKKRFLQLERFLSAGPATNGNVNGTASANVPAVTASLSVPGPPSVLVAPTVPVPPSVPMCPSAPVSPSIPVAPPPKEKKTAHSGVKAGFFKTHLGAAKQLH